MSYILYNIYTHQAFIFHGFLVKKTAQLVPLLFTAASTHVNKLGNDAGDGCCESTIICDHQGYNPLPLTEQMQS